MAVPLMGILIATVALLGLAIGSFLNVVVWRLPRGESLSHPPSACPRCRHAIRARDNVPVLGWLLLRGRCRDCGTPISPRYPLVEALTGVVFVLVALRFGFDPPGIWATPAFLYLASIGIALALIDLDIHRLPNRIVLPSYIVGIALLSVASAGSADWWALVRAVIAALVLFIFYLVLAIAAPQGMGFGDVKLAGVLGLFLGWLGWDALVVGAFAAFVIGGLFSIGLLLTRRASRKSGIPFGPWMLLGSGVGIFFGEGIARWYLSVVGLA